jgi:hypothetical protein
MKEIDWKFESKQNQGIFFDKERYIMLHFRRQTENSQGKKRKKVQDRWNKIHSNVPWQKG